METSSWMVISPSNDKNMIISMIWDSLYETNSDKEEAEFMLDIFFKPMATKEYQIKDLPDPQRTFCEYIAMKDTDRCMIKILLRERIQYLFPVMKMAGILCDISLKSDDEKEKLKRKTRSLFHPDDFEKLEKYVFSLKIKY